MNKTQSQTKAAKARKSWQLLQEEQQFAKQKELVKKTIPLKVAHNRETTNDVVADSA